jgi:hypothetical protein
METSGQHFSTTDFAEQGDGLIRYDLPIQPATTEMSSAEFQQVVDEDLEAGIMRAYN